MGSPDDAARHRIAGRAIHLHVRQHFRGMRPLQGRRERGMALKVAPATERRGEALDEGRSHPSPRPTKAGPRRSGLRTSLPAGGIVLAPRCGSQVRNRERGPQRGACNRPGPFGTQGMLSGTMLQICHACQNHCQSAPINIFLTRCRHLAGKGLVSSGE